MDSQQLAHFRQRLLEEARRYREQIEHINDSGLGQSMSEAYEEFSMYDNHPADAGSEMYERQKDLGLRSNAQRMLKYIDHALARMEAGEYGRCESCGAAISPERLEAFPMTTLCRRCKERQEELPDAFQRPAEEKVLVPPFGRTFRDQGTWVGWDGEDALQDALVYGSSDTPQDLPGAITYDDLVHSMEQPGVAEPVEQVVDETGEPLQADDPRRMSREL